MPLLKEWNIGEHGRAAIWVVEEPESFFKKHTGLDPQIKNDKRRIEHLAGRLLLQRLAQDFPLHDISKDEHDKPRITDNKYFFSISHSWPYIAAIIDTHREAGIDIETYKPRISNIRHKFLSAGEQLIFGNDERLLTAAWTAKEAVYKWNGRRNVAFIEDLPIGFFEQSHDVNNMSFYFKLSPKPKMIFVENIITTEFTYSYVNYAEDWIIT